MVLLQLLLKIYYEDSIFSFGGGYLTKGSHKKIVTNIQTMPGVACSVVGCHNNLTNGKINFAAFMQHIMGKENVYVAPLSSDSHFQRKGEILKEEKYGYGMWPERLLIIKIGNRNLTVE